MSFRQKDFSNKKDFTLKVTSKKQLRVCKSLLLIKKGLINLYLFLFFLGDFCFCIIFLKVWILYNPVIGGFVQCLLPGLSGVDLKFLGH